MPIDLTDERKWADDLAEIRWPNGFHCEQCDRTTPYWRHSTRPRTFICAVCKTTRSVTAGTFMHRTRLPLKYWFVAATLLAEDGVSALLLAGILGVHVETAWQLAQRIRMAMGPDRATLDGLVTAMHAFVACRPPLGMRGADRLLVVVASESEDAPEGPEARTIVVPTTDKTVLDDLGGRVHGDVVTGELLMRGVIRRTSAWGRRARRLPTNPRSARIHADLLQKKDAVAQREETGLPFSARRGETDEARRRLRELQGFLGGVHGSVSKAWADGYLREFVARSRGGGQALERSLLANVLNEKPYRFDDIVRAKRAAAALFPRQVAL